MASLDPSRVFPRLWLRALIGVGGGEVLKGKGRPIPNHPHLLAEATPTLLPLKILQSASGLSHLLHPPKTAVLCLAFLHPSKPLSDPSNNTEFNESCFYDIIPFLHHATKREARDMSALTHTGSRTSSQPRFPHGPSPDLIPVPDAPSQMKQVPHSLWRTRGAGCSTLPGSAVARPSSQSGMGARHLVQKDLPDSHRLPILSCCPLSFHHSLCSSHGDGGSHISGLLPVWSVDT